MSRRGVVALAALLWLVPSLAGAQPPPGWRNIGPGPVLVNQLLPDPSAPGVLYLATPGGLYKSADDGDSWSTLDAGLNAFSLAVDPTDSSILYADGSRSVDGGRTWQQLRDVGAITVSVHDPRRLYGYRYTLTEHVLRRSDDGGATWVDRRILPYDPLAAWPYEVGLTLNRVVVSATDPMVLFASGRLRRAYVGCGESVCSLIDERFYLSRDRGDTWQVVDSASLYWSPTSAVYIGDVWELVPFFGGVNVPLRVRQSDRLVAPDLAFHINRIPGGTRAVSVGHGSLFAAVSCPMPLGACTGLMRSRDGGNTWQWLDAPPTPRLNGDDEGLAIGPVDHRRLYVTGLGRSPGGPVLSRSFDGGDTWEEVALPSALVSARLATDPLNPDIVYARATADTFAPHRSTDAGTSWSSIEGDLPIACRLSTGRLLVHPTVSNLLYSACRNVLYRSENGGTDWTTVTDFDVVLNTPGQAVPVSSTITDAYVDPQRANTLYVAASWSVSAEEVRHGLVVTFDAGAHWQVLPPNFAVKRLVFAGDALFVTAGPGSDRSEVHRSDDGGLSWIRIDRVSGSTYPGLVADPSSGDVYVAARPGGVFRLLNGGTDWVPIGFESGVILHLAPGGASPLFAVAGSLWRRDARVHRTRSDVSDLNGDGRDDVFALDRVTGAWTNYLSNGDGFAAGGEGGWAPGWTVAAAEFNGDDFTDFLLYHRGSGQFYLALNDRRGQFTYEGGGWAPGWEAHILDLNGDTLSDVFLYNPTTGVWYKVVTVLNGDSIGLDYDTGGWAPGWELHVGRFDADARDDLFLYSRQSGVWYTALSRTGPTFAYESSTWAPTWNLTVGDFNGDRLSDLFLYDQNSGYWYQALNTASGFTYRAGQWAPGWTIHAADWNADRTSDLLLYSEGLGYWYKVHTVGAGFTYEGGAWANWSRWVVDLNGDGASDVLLYDAASGIHYRAISVPGGFSYTVGQWAPGLQLIPQ